MRGTLDMLILRTLALEPMHGYGIGVRLEQVSRGALRVTPVPSSLRFAGFLNGTPLTIVGVMPREFDFSMPYCDYWAPISPF